MPMQISGVTIQGGMNILPRAGAPSPSPTPGPTPGPSDPNFSNVVFMFDGDGTDGGANNTFTDSSSNSHAITENGDVTQGSFSPYGDNWSWYTKDSAIAFSTFSTTGDYTAEAWVLVNAIDSSGYNIIFYGGNNTQLSIGSLGGIGTVLNGSGVIGRNYSADTNDGSWHHVAWCRSGTTNRVFLDGNLVGSGTSSSEIRIQQISGYSSGYEHDGYISNARVTNTALYTANFTPPTEPLTEVTGTHILTAQSNRFVDNSSNQRTLTINRGTPKVTPFSPFTNSDARDITTDGGSGYFNISNQDYLTYSGGSSTVGDITVSGWIYVDQSTGVNNSLYPRVFASGGTQFLIYLRDDVFRVYNDGEVLGVGINRNQWYHFVVQRTSGTFELWLNGESQATGSNSTNINLNTTNYIGADPSGGYYGGYITDLKVTEDSEGYSGNFTPPAAPVSAGSSDLLLNFQDSAIYDYSGLNNIDTIGDAQINTSIKKFGTGSVKFDGTGDYLEIPSSDAFDLGTDDWTIEGWIYPETDSDDRGAVFELYNDDNNVLRIMMQVNDEIEFRIESGGTSVVDIRSTNWNYDEWMHVAAVNNSGTITFYLNGTSEGTDSSFTMPDFSSARVLLGMDLLAVDRWYTGYIDDFRVTKGIARYTSNFTPPTEALPKF